MISSIEIHLQSNNNSNIDESFSINIHNNFFKSNLIFKMKTEIIVISLKSTTIKLICQEIEILLARTI